MGEVKKQTPNHDILSEFDSGKISFTEALKRVEENTVARVSAQIDHIKEQTGQVKNSDVKKTG